LYRTSNTFLVHLSGAQSHAAKLLWGYKWTKIFARQRGGRPNFGLKVIKIDLQSIDQLVEEVAHSRPKSEDEYGWNSESACSWLLNIAQILLRPLIPTEGCDTQTLRDTHDYAEAVSLYPFNPHHCRRSLLAYLRDGQGRGGLEGY
jgi:hypothetical protein